MAKGTAKHVAKAGPDILRDKALWMARIILRDHPDLTAERLVARCGDRIPIDIETAESALSEARSEL